MTTRRTPFALKDGNANEATPRRSTRVSVRKENAADRSISSISPIVALVPMATTPGVGSGRATRHRRVTLSPSEAPSRSNTKAVAAKVDGPSTIKVAASIAPKKRCDVNLPVPNKSKRIKIGRWEKWEQIAFLKGLREHGRGHWKTIGESIPTRTTVQVKTHAQVELKKLDDGHNIFDELDRFLKEKEDQKQQQTKKTSEIAVSGDVYTYETPKQKGARRQIKRSRDVRSTPIVSNKGTIEPTEAPPTLFAFSSSSSVTTTTLTMASALGSYSPKEWSHTVTQLALHPLRSSGTSIPPLMLPFSKHAIPGVSFPFSSTWHSGMALEGGPYALSPNGASFGTLEAASALLGLSTYSNEESGEVASV